MNQYQNTLNEKNYYYLAQLQQKDFSIQKLKEEINNLLLNLNLNNQYNISDSEKEQIMKKNHDLIEENEHFKLKIKNQIENEKEIMKDKIRSNILINSQSDK